MSPQVGDNIKWTHPETREVYYFAVAGVESFGCQHTITLKDGRKFEVWDHEIGQPDEVEIYEDQINPKDFETVAARMML